ncbi:MAG: TetR/AcrR family transcriptional regulator C-terminal domain-containing protein [Pseudonocardiaceae bacterium]
MVVAPVGGQGPSDTTDNVILTGARSRRDDALHLCAGKAELLDLMLDSAYTRMSRTDTAGAPWRQRLIAIVEEHRALSDAHPWATTVSTLRPPLGPGTIAKYEHELAALDGLGLGDAEMLDSR